MLASPSAKSNAGPAGKKTKLNPAFAVDGTPSGARPRRASVRTSCTRTPPVFSNRLIAKNGHSSAAIGLGTCVVTAIRVGSLRHGSILQMEGAQTRDAAMLYLGRLTIPISVARLYRMAQVYASRPDIWPHRNCGEEAAENTTQHLSGIAEHSS
jgi:hypothetical protein